MKPERRLVICAKVMPTEAERIKAHAKKLGVSLSGFIRQVVVEAVGDEAKQRKTNRRRAAA